MALHTVKLGEQGEHVLVLHGWGRSGVDFQFLGEALSSKYIVHLIDLPGFGNSSHPGSDWSADDYAAEMIRYCDTAGIRTVNVLGHSFGGKIALAMAERYPERIQRLILSGSAGLKNQRGWYHNLRGKGLFYAGKAIKKWDAARGTRYFSEWFAPQFGSADYRAAGSMRSILVKSVNEDYSDRLPKVQAPVLLLWGSRDTETLPEVARRMEKALPHATLIMFPKKDHYFPYGVGGHLIARYAIPFLQQEGKSW